jgi:hypothetical protein
MNRPLSYTGHGFSKHQLHDHRVMYSIDPVCKAVK